MYQDCSHHPLPCSSFERLLDHTAKAEERNILDIRPTPEEYRLALLFFATALSKLYLVPLLTIEYFVY